MIFHVLNGGVDRRNLFDKADDFEAFERVLKEMLRLRWMRVCRYCWISNHWHLVLWPERERETGGFHAEAHPGCNRGDTQPYQGDTQP